MFALTLTWRERTRSAKSSATLLAADQIPERIRLRVPNGTRSDGLTASGRQLRTRTLNRYFSYKGLRHYKAKFEPAWEPRFLVYQGGPPGLVQTALALARATEG